VTTAVVVRESDDRRHRPRKRTIQYAPALDGSTAPATFAQ
jgi:hypothetical protein